MNFFLKKMIQKTVPLKWIGILMMYIIFYLKDYS